MASTIVRSLAEIRFRLRQEVVNAVLRWFPPSPPPAAFALAFPDPKQMALHSANSLFRRQVRAVVEQVLSGSIPALGLTLHTGSEIHWRRDYLSEKETPPLYFRRIPYLDPARSGDHKVIWEINRHQHLTALSQETLFADAHPGAAPELFRQLDSWLDANPFQCGINWSSALEVAFRALSWLWIDHFAGPRFPASLYSRFHTALYCHGLHLENNLSIYFSPNTHLLGEALALYSLGKAYPAWPRSRSWIATGSRIVEQEMRRQVRADGSHFELSPYYHVYAMDMFQFYALLADPGAEFQDQLANMATFLDHLLGPSRQLPLFGDDDGGRLFHPYGDRTRWAQETLSACAVYLRRPEWRHGPKDDPHPLLAWCSGSVPLDPSSPVSFSAPSRLFTASSIAVLNADGMQVLMDAGPFGPGSAGHSHSDTLSILVRSGAQSILIDPGTFTYVGDPLWRDRFRGSAAHNTVRINGLDQATPRGPFGWQLPHPQAAVLRWETRSALDILEARCAYAGFFHHRRLVFVKPEQLLLIIDRIEGPAGAHLLEWFWHPGESVIQAGSAAIRIGARSVLVWDPTLTASLSEGGEFGWRSPALGVKQAAPVLCLTHHGALPQQRVAVLHCAAPDGPVPTLTSDSETALYGHLRVNLQSGDVRRI